MYIYIYVYLNHFAVYLKLIQYCKSTKFQQKKKEKATYIMEKKWLK